MDRGAWRSMAHGVAESDTTEVTEQEQVRAPWGLSGGSMDEESTCSEGDPGDAGSMSGSGRSPGEGHSN